MAAKKYTGEIGLDLFQLIALRELIEQIESHDFDEVNFTLTVTDGEIKKWIYTGETTHSETEEGKFE